MLRSTYNLLRKIADDASQPLPAPTREHVLDVLGMTESGYNPYAADAGKDFNKYYIRTKVRGTYGDPTINPKDWTSSTAWGPWQVNADRSTDIAKYDPEYAKYHNSTLTPMYKEMLRTGLGGYLYNIFKTKNQLPKGFKGKYVAAYDYGGHPFDLTHDQHRTVRNGMLTYIDKVMLPTAQSMSADDVEQQWKTLAAIHHLGHPMPRNDREREKFDKYWTMLRPQIAYMQQQRGAWKQAELARWNKIRETYRAMDPKDNPALPKQLKALDAKIAELSTGY